MFYLHLYHKYEKMNKTLCLVHISFYCTDCVSFHTYVSVFSTCKSLWFSCYFAIWSLNVWTGWKKAHLAWFIYERLHLGAICPSLLKHQGFICPLTQILAAYSTNPVMDSPIYSTQQKYETRSHHSPTADWVS